MVQTMRLTVNVDDDLYALAKSVAVAEGCSLSAAFNKLLRRALEPRGELKKLPSGVPVVPCLRRFDSSDVYEADLQDGSG